LCLKEFGGWVTGARLPRPGLDGLGELRRVEAKHDCLDHQSLKGLGDTVDAGCGRDVLHQGTMSR